MRGYKFFKGINNIADDLIEEAAHPQKKKTWNHNIIKFAGLVAMIMCLLAATWLGKQADIAKENQSLHGSNVGKSVETTEKETDSVAYILKTEEGTTQLEVQQKGEKEEVTTVEIETTRESEVCADVEIYAESIDANGGVFVIAQNAYAAVTYDEYYHLECLTATGEKTAFRTKIAAYKYKACEEIGEIEVHDIAYELGKGEQQRFEIKWKERYGTLPEGDYRLVKKISMIVDGKRQDSNLYYYFEIR